MNGSPEPWKKMNSTTEVKELGWIYPWEGVEATRAVAVRRKARPPKRRKGKKKGEREWDLKYMIVTGVPHGRLGTRSVFKRYHNRQQEEFSFKDGKQSLATAKMPTQKLQANRMHVKMVGLAQVMLRLYAWNFLPRQESYGSTCKTIREKVIAVGGENRAGGGGVPGAGVLCVPLAAALGGENPR